ncbi:polyprenyl synthetase [Flavobacterium davisii]|uniref:Polyprenyl synthetase n=1 Tax=Flavobacterium davisii TaxID=2906077 RepID=A0A246GHW5_9FLAO|nr:polyprenyl synthetase family protein [Flavobacterium davisii]OWP83796.1 polyprenyl synthetase [Flavobacterium davisii]
MQAITTYQDIITKHFEDLSIKKDPLNLYDPIQYILSLGGKRIRPVLTLIATEIFDCSYKKALSAATAVEVFHNFSLVHDDIMDNAPLRRGHETVHEKWNINTGILSGDAMLILAYQYFEDYEPIIFKELAQLFSKTALEVCEGQQYDVDFETRKNVSVTEYLKMIEYKTAVLVGAALKMGAIVAQTSSVNAHLIYEFGLNLGIAFQLQDDYLDAFGDPLTFGKQIGGDIIENKKTYLYIKALEFASKEEKNQLQQLYSIQSENNTDKIETIKKIFNSTGASTATLEAIKEYTLKSFATLEKINISEEKKVILKTFGENLMNRNV